MAIFKKYKIENYHALCFISLSGLSLSAKDWIISYSFYYHKFILENEDFLDFLSIGLLQLILHKHNFIKIDKVLCSILNFSYNLSFPTHILMFPHVLPLFKIPLYPQMCSRQSNWISGYSSQSWKTQFKPFTIGTCVSVTLMLYREKES